MDSLDAATLQKLLGIVPEDKRKEIEAKVDATLAIFEAKLQRGFNRPEITYDLEGHTAGYYVWDSNGNGTTSRIRLNRQLLNSEHYDDMLNRTVPHEVAHLVQKVLYPHSKHHGAEWQYLMALIGLSPERTHSYTTVARRKSKPRARPFKYQCACRTRMLTATIHRRIQNGGIYTCKTCGAVVRKSDD